MTIYKSVTIIINTLQMSLSVYVLKLISLIFTCYYITWHRR